MIWSYLFGQKGKMFLVGTEEFGVLIIVMLLFVLRTMESCQNIPDPSVLHAIDDIEWLPIDHGKKGSMK